MSRVASLAAAVAAILSAASSPALATTVLYADQTIEVRETLADPNDLWVRPASLPEVNGFELKPEGACIDDICVPVRQDEDSAIFVTRGDVSWFNVTELARRLGQPFVADHDAGVWSFGAIPARRASFYQRGVAPDFTLPDRTGNEVTLADYDGMKVLLLTWASW